MKSFLESLKVSESKDANWKSMDADWNSKDADWQSKDAKLERPPVILCVLKSVLGVLAGRTDSADRRRAALKDAQQLLAELPRQPVCKL
jgi:hypothetical protein